MIQISKKTILFLITICILFSFVLIPQAHAQMMGQGNMMQVLPSGSLSAADNQDIQTGQDLFTQFQAKKLNCQNLQQDDFEKIGEYLMNNQMGNVRHAQMNRMLEQMMGTNGEEQMHITIGERATNCPNNQVSSTNQVITNTQRGGAPPMMNWGYQNMMGFGNGFENGFGIIFLIFHLIILVDLVLVGIWLWQQITKHHTK